MRTASFYVVSKKENGLVEFLKGKISSDLVSVYLVVNIDEKYLLNHFYCHWLEFTKRHVLRVYYSTLA